MSSRSRQLDQISAGRIARADSHGKAKSPSNNDRMMNSGPLTGLSLTAVFGTGEALNAARGVARAFMRNTHGCTGTSCRDSAHDADKAVRDMALEILGLRPYESGTRRKPRYGETPTAGAREGRGEAR